MLYSRSWIDRDQCDGNNRFSNYGMRRVAIFDSSGGGGAPGMGGCVRVDIAVVTPVDDMTPALAA